MGNCHSKAAYRPSETTSAAVEISETIPPRALPVAMREIRHPAPPYTATASAASPPYLHLEYHSSSTSGSFLLRPEGKPKLLYETHKPISTSNRPRLPFRRLQSSVDCCSNHKTMPDLQVINMATSLIVGTVRYNDRVRHDTDAKEPSGSKTRISFPRTSKEITYSPDNKSFMPWYSSKDLRWTSESGLTSGRIVLTCADAQGVTTCEIMVKLPSGLATVNILEICETQEQLDEIVVCAVTELEEILILSAKLDKMLTDCGF